eukprot:gene9679-biopygen83959
MVRHQSSSTREVGGPASAGGGALGRGSLTVVDLCAAPPSAGPGTLEAAARSRAAAHAFGDAAAALRKGAHVPSRRHRLCSFLSHVWGDGARHVVALHVDRGDSSCATNTLLFGLRVRGSDYTAELP